MPTPSSPDLDILGHINSSCDFSEKYCCLSSFFSLLSEANDVGDFIVYAFADAKGVDCQPNRVGRCFNIQTSLQLHHSFSILISSGPVKLLNMYALMVFSGY